ncbi:MAG: prolyl-tRNA synthetase associated domain-containing protein [Desulfobacterales bacterium]
MELEHHQKEKALFIVMGPSPLLAFLDEHGIDCPRCDHPAVFTVDEAARWVPPLPGAKTKNLFLRDKSGRRHFLVCVPAAKSVDMRALSDAIGAGRLSFGSPERLKKHLGIEPGAVTLFAVFNDPAHAVELYVDEELWQADAFQFHPLVNTSTLVISRESVERFLQLIGHPLHLVTVGGRGDEQRVME